VGRPLCFRNAVDDRSALQYDDTKTAPIFKALVTLLELNEASLHDEEITGVTRKAWAV